MGRRRRGPRWDWGPDSSRGGPPRTPAPYQRTEPRAGIGAPSNDFAATGRTDSRESKSPHVENGRHSIHQSRLHDHPQSASLYRSTQLYDSYRPGEDDRRRSAIDVSPSVPAYDSYSPQRHGPRSSPDSQNDLETQGGKGGSDDSFQSKASTVIKLPLKNDTLPRSARPSGVGPGRQASPESGLSGIRGELETRENTMAICYDARGGRKEQGWPKRALQNPLQSLKLDFSSPEHDFKGADNNEPPKATNVPVAPMSQLPIAASIKRPPTGSPDSSPKRKNKKSALADDSKSFTIPKRSPVKNTVAANQKAFLDREYSGAGSLIERFGKPTMAQSTAFRKTASAAHHDGKVTCEPKTETHRGLTASLGGDSEQPTSGPYFHSENDARAPQPEGVGSLIPPGPSKGAPRGVTGIHRPFLPSAAPAPREEHVIEANRAINEVRPQPPKHSTSAKDLSTVFSPLRAKGLHVGQKSAQRTFPKKITDVVNTRKTPSKADGARGAAHRHVNFPEAKEAEHPKESKEQGQLKNSERQVDPEKTSKAKVGGLTNARHGQQASPHETRAGEGSKVSSADRRLLHRNGRRKTAWEYLVANIPTQYGSSPPVSSSLFLVLRDAPAVRVEVWNKSFRGKTNILNPQHINGLLMYVSGLQAGEREACHNCMGHRGPFQHCIFMPKDIKDKIKQQYNGCANCVWTGDGKDCEHNTVEKQGSKRDIDLLADTTLDHKKKLVQQLNQEDRSVYGSIIAQWHHVFAQSLAQPFQNGKLGLQTGAVESQAVPPDSPSIGQVEDAGDLPDMDDTSELFRE